MAAPVFAGLDLNHLRAPNNATPSWGRSKPLSLNTFADALLRGPDWAEFLTSDLGYEDGNDEDWLPTKVLSKGGFGKVALWSKKDELSDVVDTIAVKQRMLEHTPRSATGIWMNNLAREAYIQSQLTSNDQHGCIVPLRGYKYYAVMHQCRLYMEYAPHGALDTVGRRYRASDRYLPELWLWQPMEDRSRKLPQILLVKLGDFGLAQVTSATALNNRDMLTGGTMNYMPPETRVETDPPLNHHFDTFWQTPVNPWRQKYIEQHNIWAVGKVMHDLAFLKDPGLCHQQLFALREQDYYDPAHPICGHFALPFDTTNARRPVDYSQSLRDLIRDCLLPDMILRPDSQNLLDNVQTYKQNCIDSIKRQNRHQRPREADNVYLTNVEMNGLPYRPEANFPTGVNANGVIADQAWAAWQELRDSDYLDPDELLFAPPRAKWTAFYQREHQMPPPHRRKTNDVRARRWVQVGQKVQLKPNLDELLNQHRQQEGNRRPKRMLSWDENTERDAVVRQKLRDLRVRAPYADRQPLAMFDFVLQNTGHVVGDAEEVLRWLYQPRAQDPGWAWL